MNEGYFLFEFSESPSTSVLPSHGQADRGTIHLCRYNACASGTFADGIS